MKPHGRDMQFHLRGKLDGIDRTIVLAHQRKHPFTLPVVGQAISSRPPRPHVCLVVHLATFRLTYLTDMFPLY